MEVRFRKSIHLALVFLLLCLTSLSLNAQVSGDQKPSITVLSTVESIPAGDSFAIIARYEIPKGIHLTENFLELRLNEPEGFSSGMLQVTSGTFEKGEIIRRGTVYLKLPIQIEKRLSPGTYHLKGTASYQVCTDGEPSMCYPPADVSFDVPVTVTAGGNIQQNEKANEWNQRFESKAGNAGGGNRKLSLSERLTNALNKNLMLAFLLVFIGGFLTSLTPCVYPMIPITIGYIGGKSAGQGRSRGFVLSLFYVLGLALIYSLLGVVAAVTGSLFGSITQTPAVIGGVGAIFFIMGLSMLGLFDIALPSSIAGKLQGGGPRKGFLGAVIMGMVAGLVAAPCAGPVIIVLLAFIATTGNIIIGFTLMMTFAFGMGLLFIAIGTFSGLLTSLPQAGAWMDKIKKGFGVILILASFWIIRPLLPPPLFGSLMGISIAIIGSMVGAFDPIGSESTLYDKFRRGVGLMLFVIGLYWLVSLCPVPGKVVPKPGSTSGGSEVVSDSIWTEDLDGALARAKKENKRLILDFGAEWCAACKELEHETFNQPEVIKRLKEMIPVKIDSTNAKDPNIRKIQEKYGVKGLPTVIVLDRNGEEISRFVSFLPPAQFLEFLAQVDKIEKGE